jgi:hypothetical protein
MSKSSPLACPRRYCGGKLETQRASAVAEAMAGQAEKDFFICRCLHPVLAGEIPANENHLSAFGGEKQNKLCVFCASVVNRGGC